LCFRGDRQSRDDTGGLEKWQGECLAHNPVSKDLSSVARRCRRTWTSFFPVLRHHNDPRRRNNTENMSVSPFDTLVVVRELPNMRTVVALLSRPSPVAIGYREPTGGM
jgi:hypothetical protein